MERKHMCKEESKRPDIGGGEERISDDLQLLYLSDWELGRPCDSNREVRKGTWLREKKTASSIVDKLGFQRWRDIQGKKPAGRKKSWPGAWGNAQPEIPHIWLSYKNREC